MLSLSRSLVVSLWRTPVSCFVFTYSLFLSVFFSTNHMSPACVRIGFCIIFSPTNLHHLLYFSAVNYPLRFGLLFLMPPPPSVSFSSLSVSLFLLLFFFSLSDLSDLIVIALPPFRHIHSLLFIPTFTPIDSLVPMKRQRSIHWLTARS